MNPSAATPHPLTRFWLANARWILAGLLLAGYPLSGVLPPEFGWENNWIENFQLLVLLGGLAAAIHQYRTPRDGTLSRLALCVIPIWSLCAARETSWGATFLTAATMEADGPSFTSRNLWYHPGIAPLVVVLLAFSAYVFVRRRLDRPMLQLVRQRQFPWFELALCVVAAGLSAAAEGHAGGFKLPGIESAMEVMEEWSETLVYLGLLTAQMRIFRALAEAPPT